MSRRSAYLLVGCVILLLVVLFVTGKTQKTDSIVAPTAMPTATLDSTATATPTIPSITIVIVTPVPTETPTQVPETQVPTETPVVTPEPTAVPTEVPTAEPTATVIPTVAPTTPPVTQVPEDTEKKYATVDEELRKLTIMEGIYPDYSSAPSYDLYTYIDVNGLDQARLFKIMRKPFESGIAQWTDMKFTSGSAIDMLSFALNSSICEYCGRIKITESPANLSQITAIFDAIEKNGNQETANRILLDYLYKYTRQNPNNPTERLIISCNDK